MDVEQIRKHLNEAIKSDANLRGMRWLPTLSTIDLESPGFKELNFNEKYNFYMILGKLYLRKGASTNSAHNFIEARKLSEEAGEKEKAAWADIQRSRVFEMKATPGDRVHAGNIIKKATAELKDGKIKVFGDFYQVMIKKYDGCITMKLALNNILSDLNKLGNSNECTAADKKQIKYYHDECLIWIAVQEFRKNNCKTALGILDKYTRYNVDPYLYIMARTESAFMQSFGCGEYTMADIMLDEVMEYYDNIDPLLKLIALLARVMVSVKTGKDYANDKENLEAIWNSLGEDQGKLTKASLLKHYDAIQAQIDKRPLE